jgi:hypothetical protein
VERSHRAEPGEPEAEGRSQDHASGGVDDPQGPAQERAQPGRGQGRSDLEQDGAEQRAGQSGHRHPGRALAAGKQKRGYPRAEEGAEDEARERQQLGAETAPEARQGEDSDEGEDEDVDGAQAAKRTFGWPPRVRSAMVRV